jgi:hypothetical protein
LHETHRAAAIFVADHLADSFLSMAHLVAARYWIKFINAA